jgi:hypothetical protein
MSDDSRAEFDFSLDEAVELHLVELRGTRSGVAWRKGAQWQFAAAFALVLAVVLLMTDRARNVTCAVWLVGAAIALGLILMVPYGWYYDHLTETRMRDMLVEGFGPGPYRCSLEIRPDGLWASQWGVERIFLWSEASSIEDTPEGILTVFKAGRVLARSRGFRSSEHRQKFLDALREWVPGK